ncbi:MAG: TonB-dependent receptor [Opitutae bacterium]|nr:TonB-dependent receptor [Opitutae bacterium]
MTKHNLTRLAVILAALTAGAVAQEKKSTEPAGEEVLQLEKFSVNGVPIEQVVLPTARPFNSVFGFDRSILDTPRNVTIISREQLTSISISDVRDFSKLTASSYTRSNFGAPTTPDIRTQIADTFLNGMRIGLSSNGNGLPVNFNSVESVNIVKGPATAIFGASQYIGGYADLITKRPDFSSAKGYFSATIGSYDTYRWTFDYGAPVSKTAAYRISYSGEDAGSYYTDGYKKSQALYAALTYRPNDRYDLFMNAEAFYAEYTENFGINRVTQDLIDKGLYQTGVNNNPAPNFTTGPVVGYVDSTGAPITFTNINVVGGTAAPQSDPQNSRWVVSGFPAVNRIALGPVVKIDRRQRLLRPGDNSNGFSFNGQAIQQWHSSPDLTVANNTMFRYVRRNTLSSYSYSEIIDPSWSLENRTEFRLTKNAWEINTGLALRYQAVKAYNDFFNEPANVWDLTKDRNFINYFNSVNSPNPFTQIAVPGWPGRYYTPDNGDSGQSKAFTTSPFFQANWKVSDKFALEAGGRVDMLNVDFKSKWVNTIIGAQSIADKVTVGLPNYNASMRYKISKTVSAYATYNYSQNPVGATGNGGGVTTSGGAKFFNANLRNEAKLTEVGFKQTYDEGKGYISAAFFRQDRDDLQQDRSTVRFKTQGFEIEGSYQPNKHLYLTGGYSYLDSTVNTGQFDVGNTSLTPPTSRFFILGPGENRRQGVPKNLVNALATYKWDNGFGVTANVVYTTKINNNVVGNLVIPSQYTLDLTAFYNAKDWEVRFAILNATDERNWSAPNAVYGNESIVAELPVNFQASFKYKF